jgi:hypothetical protein
MPSDAATLRIVPGAEKPSDPFEASRQHPANLDRGFTVRDLTVRWRVGEGKILEFVRTGELVGINLALHMGARPQWRFTREAVETFEQRRSSTPTPNPRRRRRRPNADEIDYFPD